MGGMFILVSSVVVRVRVAVRMLLVVLWTRSLMGRLSLRVTSSR